MDISGQLNATCRTIGDNCLGCGQCIAECHLLQEIDEDIASIAERQLSVAEAYSCTLCGLCSAVCPQDLKITEMFALRRAQAVAQHEIDIDQFRYLFPDRAANVTKVYRAVKGISYAELKVDQEGRIAFFPGCTLMTYNPQLTKAVVASLQEKYPELTLLTDCCGLPLVQLGLWQRAEDFVQRLTQKLRRLKVETMVIACPNCYYRLREVLTSANIEPLTIFEALKDSRVSQIAAAGRDEVVTIHDSCPDRRELKFARQAREALRQKGYQLVEMEHSENHALCCGSGGQVTHTRPDLVEQMTRSRINEAKAAGANLVTASCLGCVLNLNKEQNEIPVVHVLNLLLGIKQDYYGLKKRSKEVFEGPEGEKLWQQIMAD